MKNVIIACAVLLAACGSSTSAIEFPADMPPSAAAPVEPQAPDAGVAADVEPDAGAPCDPLVPKAAASQDGC